MIRSGDNLPANLVIQYSISQTISERRQFAREFDNLIQH